MPRGGGVYGLPYPVLAGEPRSSDEVDADFADIGAELTNTLALDGQGGMLGVLPLDEVGAVFAVDTNTGFRRVEADTFAFFVGGVDRLTIDENGLATLANGISVAGATNLTSTIDAQALMATGSPVATFRRNENDTTERILVRYASGDGSGATATLRMSGSGSNAVAKLAHYIESTKILEFQATIATASVRVSFASKILLDSSGYADFPEIAAPGAPASDKLRLYFRDASGLTKPFMHANGAEVDLMRAMVTREVFTSSGTWNKPAYGTVAFVEMWGGGASGASEDDGGGGGGGCYNCKLFALADLPSSVTVTVGAGGAAATGGNNPGNPGGVSSFGTLLFAYGGGGGGEGTSNDGGGGGGGQLAGGAQGEGEAGGQGGSPRSRFASGLTWGAQPPGGDDPKSNPFGGASGGSNASFGGVALFGGGGGGGGVGAGGSSIFGGGGGAGENSATGGTSIYGGNGGGADTNGTAPGGGGGASDGTSGAGARGEVRVTVW